VDCSEIYQELEELYENDPDMVIVSHDPMSDRYIRAGNYFDDLICEGAALGARVVSKGKDERKYELVLFASPGVDEMVQGAKGKYAAFRIIFQKEPGIWKAKFAELFAFYDDDPIGGDGNHGFSTEREAKEFMIKEFPEYQKSEVFNDED